MSKGDPLALALADGVGFGVANGSGRWAVAASNPAETARWVEQLDRDLRPRWVWWDNSVASALLRHGIRPSTCWDVAAVHRLLSGTWRAEPASVWARANGLASDGIPELGQLDLLSAPVDDGGDPADPVLPDGHLRPEWCAGGWSADAERLAAWAEVAHCAMTLLTGQLSTGRLRAGIASIGAVVALATARSESAAELLAAELAHDGLPIDVDVATRLIEASVGPRPRSDADADAARTARDAIVLAHAPLGGGRDLRNPANVKSMLQRVGVDVPDTRAWRLEEMRDGHPFVDALLTWRKAERISTTFGYGWLEAHVGADGRLRGAWSASDGAAGRMTAQAGLHNLPADLRPAVIAEPGHVFVRADLGQIELRVLAAVSGDQQFASATQADDLYANVARRLGVDRPVAKIAVLAAMYGQTSGAAGQALRGLEAAYPVAMQYLREAEERGRRGEDIHTYGGRRVRMWQTRDDLEADQERSAVAGRGRYARNAVVQGAAAELFKVWAVTTRARLAPMAARIVLCLHDELLVHAPEQQADAVAVALHSSLDEAAHRWMPSPVGGPTRVRFVADVSVVQRWSDAKS